MFSEPFFPDCYYIVFARHVAGVKIFWGMFHDSKLIPEDIC